MHEYVFFKSTRIHMNLVTRKKKWTGIQGKEEDLTSLWSTKRIDKELKNASIEKWARYEQATHKRRKRNDQYSN